MSVNGEHPVPSLNPAHPAPGSSWIPLSGHQAPRQLSLLLRTQALAIPSGLILDRDGNVLVADRSVHKVFWIDARTGALTVIAGTGDTLA